MAEINYLKQIRYTGAGPLDAKHTPVATVDELNNIPLAQRYIGMTITVLSDPNGKQQDYWLKGNILVWKEKFDDTLLITGGDVQEE